MCKLATNLNPYKSEYFIYTDIGAWRIKQFSNWPNEEFVKSLRSYINDFGLYGQIYRVKNIKEMRVSSRYMEGGFIADTSTAFDNLCNAFYDIYDDWFKKKLFVGKDQGIINQLVFKNYTHLAKRLRTWGYTCFKRYDRWFFYQMQIFFANLPNCSINFQNSIF